ncbi:enoyl-CoA hydratase-related protein [Heliophilum fasciatum]|uniref:1,4-dihydroxy-2-naphthoyl-CoA synthase n=1 Tax=Heliophilum fasciatum TaxID=35700 RepID=A0A4R2RM62_9FIRM|nr:enoyl-CoA hydratase-related protein [Heliophilum fasciatum]MCW2278171.1 enoyl-CoA hydratase/carnithine racemase [Heliophilum fasciatum]TCP64008.1 1,4-dihydroxy-2-naphthoyl-CoA synthase [Heliophilum fasciatum]
MARFTGQPAESFDFKEIIYEKKDWVATVTFNRPHVHNSYSTLTLQELTTAFRDASWDDSVAVVVLTGAGDKAFCTGGDVKEYADDYTVRPRDYWKWMGVFVECHDALRNIGKPTIAKINGIVAGGGNEFNMACDLAIMADTATIRQVGTMVGSVAAGGATQWLPIMVGDRRAREILFLCDPIPAQKCLEWGLVNQVVPREQLDEAVHTMAQQLINKFPECLRYTKQQLNYWKDLSWSNTIGHAREWLALHFASVEPYEGMKAFVEKRPKDYIGLRQKAADGRSSEFLWGPYTQACGSCGTKGIPQDFQFCGQCGTRLG